MRRLDGRADSIRIEDPGVTKAEFVMSCNGRQELHQAKRSHRRGKWSLDSLAGTDIRVLQAVYAQLAGNDDRFVFVSGSDARELGVPGVTEQYTTILWKCLYFLVSLRASLSLRGACDVNRRRCGKKHRLQAKFHGNRGTNQGLTPTVCVDKDLRFPPHFCPLTHGSTLCAPLLRDPQRESPTRKGSSVVF